MYGVCATTGISHCLTCICPEYHFWFAFAWAIHKQDNSYFLPGTLAVGTMLFGRQDSQPALVEGLKCSGSSLQTTCTLSRRSYFPRMYMSSNHSNVIMQINVCKFNVQIYCYNYSGNPHTSSSSVVMFS